jgi:hypothetical protein
MIEKTKFKKLVGEVFSSSGFVKKGQSWFLRGTDATVLVNLQKSDFAEKYYVNIGIWLRALGECDFPKENQCQIQARLGSLFTDQVSLIDKACNLEFSEAADLDAFLALLRERLVPFCGAVLTLDGLRENAAAQRFAGALVFRQARELLEMD